MDGLFRTVLNMSITGAVIICAVMLARLCMKKLPKRFSYTLWIIPAIRLLCPVSISSAVSFFNLFKPEVSENQMAYIPSAPTVYTPAANAVPAALPDTIPIITEADITPAAEPFGIMEILLFIWITGGVIMLIINAITYINIYRRIRFAVKKGEYFLCENIDSPFVFGLFRPKIYMPEGIDETDLNCILAHEKTHIRRCDHIVKLLCIPVMTLHWFNPFIWLGIKFMTEDMELSCDEAVLKGSGAEQRKIYANALLNMSMRQNNKSFGILNFGESNIGARVKSALSAKKPAVIISVIAVITLIIISVCMLTNAVGSGPLKMKDYNSFALVKDSAARPCTANDISDITAVLERAALEKAKKENYPRGSASIEAEIRLFESDSASGIYSR